MFQYISFLFYCYFPVISWIDKYRHPNKSSNDRTSLVLCIICKQITVCHAYKIKIDPRSSTHHLHVYMELSTRVRVNLRTPGYYHRDRSRWEKFFPLSPILNFLSFSWSRFYLQCIAKTPCRTFFIFLKML